jgi:hypothetical protein
MGKILETDLEALLHAKIEIPEKIKDLFEVW